MDPRQIKIIEEAVGVACKNYPCDVAFEALRTTYQGKFWVVGGFITSIAIPLLHGYSVNHHTDLDLLLAEEVDYDQIPTMDGWERTESFFGSLRFKKGEDQVDIWSLSDVVVFQERGLDQTIENYLETVPLTTQSLVYDPEEKKLLGPMGLKALETRTVRINDRREILGASWRTVEDYIKNKAGNIGFTPIIDPE